MKAKPVTKIRPNQVVPADQLPPHSEEAETGALACVCMAAEMPKGGEAEAEKLMSQLRPELFYLEHTRAVHNELAAMLMEGHHVLTIPMLVARLQAQKKQIDLFGGLDFIQQLPDKAGSVLQFSEYRRILVELHRRRFLIRESVKMREMANAPEVSLDTIRAHFDELSERTLEASSTAPLIHIITPNQARAYEPDQADFLIGDGLIVRGNFVTIGGEPGVGKSRLATTMAVALARGYNRWMNYPVRSQTRTLILQSENDQIRLREDFEAVPKDLDDWIRVSDELSKGLAFDNPDFRRELRRYYDSWPFGVLVIDPWNEVVFEEGQRDYKQALSDIRACFYGTKMPAVVIVAHLRKRGRDERSARKTGRELLHELSGSLALGSTSRTVFVVQHVDPSMDDPRIVFEVAKANNCHPDYLKEYGTRSAWNRANGAFEAIKSFDWQAFDNPGEPDRRAVTEDMILQVFDGEKALKPAAVAKKLKVQFNIGESTAYRAIGEDGYLRHMLHRNGLGTLTLKEE